jgi:hypothetical protein
MKVGFAKNDITPRVGVELCGFGPFLCRHSIGVRDRLWARAMVAEQNGAKAALISCDLIGPSFELTRRVRSLVTAATGIPEDAVLLHGTHTHSGPNTAGIIGWGEPDWPYLETLPQRIVVAVSRAAENTVDATLSHAEVPCEGIGLNREYDCDAPPIDEVLDDGWRPAKPDLTDTTCHVIEARSQGRRIGFLSYFGCHPVVCCAESRYIHGDFPGVATNMLERESPGAVGLFLQGAQGDVNSCVVHKPQQESLLALDIIASRYANQVRNGLEDAKTIDIDVIRCHRREVAFSRKDWNLGELRRRLAECERRLSAPQITDNYATKEWDARMETVYAIALRGLIEKSERGETLSPPIEIHGIRIGPLSFLGSPFEIFQAIKNDVLARARSRFPLVMGLTNGSVGYAVDHKTHDLGGYAADMVPLMLGSVPFADIHDELVHELVALDSELQ